MYVFQEDVTASEVNKAWLLTDRLEINGRITFVSNLDELLEMIMELFREIRARLHSIVTDSFDNVKTNIGFSFDEFALIVFKSDPYLPESTVANMFNIAVEETTKIKLINNDLDEISLVGWLSAPIKGELSKRDTRTYCKLARRTGALSEKQRLNNDALVSKVKLMSSLDGRQRYRVAERKCSLLVGPLEFIQKKTLYEFDKLSTQ